MAEQLGLWDGPAGSTPRVPPVVFRPCPHRRSIRGEARVPCGHCQMNARRLMDGEPVEGWRDQGDIQILQAVALITQPDGSTLRLCAQHAQEHEERGKSDD